MFKYFKKIISKKTTVKNESSRKSTFNGKPATPEQEQQMNAFFEEADKGFEKVDEAFKHFDKAFEKLDE